MAQDDFLNFSERVKQAESRGRRFDEKNRLLTSPKGAQGEMQVMPKTQRDPGYGVTPARDKSPEEIARVGRDYLRAMLDRYGDEKLAAIAYNWGPKNADKWVAAGSDFSKLPKETRDYVDRVMGGTAPVEAKAPVVEPVEAGPTLGYSAKASVPTEAVSRETMAKAPAISEGAQAKLASLGPSYQAALALSMLSDDDEKKDIDSEPSVAEKWLAETASGPSALAGLEDIKIRSPFIQPVMMAGGGSVGGYADPGLSGNAILPRVVKELAPLVGDNAGGDGSISSLGVSSPGQGISNAATSLGLGLMGYGELGFAPGSMAAGAIGNAISGSQADAMGQAADALGNFGGMHGMGISSDASGNVIGFSNDASIAAADNAAFGDSGFGFGADGADAGSGDSGGDGGAAGGDSGGAWANGGEVNLDELPASEQLRLFKHGTSGKGLSGEDVQSFIAGAELPVGDSGGVSLAGNLSKMSMDQKENLARSMLASLYYKVGDGELRANVIKPMDAGAEDVLMTSFGGSYPVGQGRASVYRNMVSAPGYQGPTGYSVGYGGQVGPGFLSGGAMIPEQGSPQWQLRYQIPVGRAEGSPEEGEEVQYKKDVEGKQSTDVNRIMSSLQSRLSDVLKSPITEEEAVRLSQRPTGTKIEETGQAKEMLQFMKDVGSPVSFYKNANKVPHYFKEKGGPPSISLPLDPRYSREGWGNLTHELTHATDSWIGNKYKELTADKDKVLSPEESNFVENYKKLYVDPTRFSTKITEPGISASAAAYRTNPEELRAFGAGISAQPYPPASEGWNYYDIGRTLNPHINPTMAQEAAIMRDIARRNIVNPPVKRGDGSPEQGEVAAPTAEELEAASKPAFLTPKSGIGRKISTKPGEIEGAVLQGVSETPYNLLGAVADIPAMLMRPFGYDVKSPAFGSEWLKEWASSSPYVRRQPPPTDPTTKAFYELGQLGGSSINPAAPVRGAVAAAQKTGEAAKMLARDFQEYNRALAVPGASYAVRMPGEPFSLEKSISNPWSNVFPSAEVKELAKDFHKRNSVDQTTNYVRELAITGDEPLDNWITQKLGMYMRRDMGTEADPFVKAAEANRQLHFAPKPTKRDPDPTRQMRGDLSIFPEGMAYVREQSGFPPRGFAKTPYGQQVEMLTDASVWPAEKQNFNINQVPEFMKNMPPETRLMQLGTVEALRLDELRDKMSTMRSMGEGPGFSAYGLPPVKIPDRYKLDDKTLLGLTPDQASERVAQFDVWRETTRQHMASQSALKDPNLNRVELPGGVTAVQLPDLKSSPNAMQLAKDMGCDGGWCTNLEINALDYGSGDNRLHILVDKKARPVAQLTLTRLPPSKKQLLDDPSAGDSFSITELLARDNTDDFQNLQALSDIQQYVKTLDRQYGLRFVSNLNKIGMTEIPASSIVWGTSQLSKLRKQQLPANISLTDYEASLKRDAIDFENALYDINGGSKYVIKDQIASLIHDALVRLAPPQPEAVLPKPKKLSTGGMIERNTVDNRTYM